MWSSCSATCGLGTQTRTRGCNDPRPKYGGKYCQGKSKDIKKCRLKRCHMGEHIQLFVFLVTSRPQLGTREKLLNDNSQTALGTEFEVT